MKQEKTALFTAGFLQLFIINLLLSATLYGTNSTMALHLADLKISSASIGAIIGILSISSMLIRPISGWICDRVKGKYLLAGCAASISLVMIGYSAARSPLAFYILRIFHGVVFGLSTTLTTAIAVSVIPRERMGEGIGFFSLGQSIASAFAPSLALALSKYSFQFVFYAVSAAAFLALLITITFKIPDQEKQDERRQLRISDFICKKAIPFAFLTIFISSANGIESGYIAAFSKSIGVENIGWYFTVSAITLFLSRLLLGKMIDKHSFRSVLIAGSGFIAGAFLLVSLAKAEHYTAFFLLCAMLKALGIGMLQPALQAMCIRSASPGKRGAATSTYYIGADLGQGGSTLAGGFILNNYSHGMMYRFFGFFFIFLSLGSLALSVIRRMSRKNVSSESRDHLS